MRDLLLGLFGKMNCRRAQSDIALWAGNDLDETDLQCLQRHLEACPECQEYRVQMLNLMRLMEECPLRDEADEISKQAVRTSLWPALSTRLVSVPAPRADRFNGWVPAVAMAAVCLAMLLVASPQEAFPPPDSSHTAVRTESHLTHDQDAGLLKPEPLAKRSLHEPIQSLRVNFQHGPVIPYRNAADLRQEVPPFFESPLQLAPADFWEDRPIPDRRRSKLGSVMLKSQ